jgi:hypothetical protein
MRKKPRIVQGTYILLENKEILTKEAKKQDVTPTTLASEILERELQKIKTRQEESCQSQS